MLTPSNHYLPELRRDSIMKTFNIASDRILHLGKNNEITIRDKVTKKAVVFTPAR